MRQNFMMYAMISCWTMMGLSSFADDVVFRKALPSHAELTVMRKEIKRPADMPEAQGGPTRWYELTFSVKTPEKEAQLVWTLLGWDLPNPASATMPASTVEGIQVLDAVVDNGTLIALCRDNDVFLAVYVIGPDASKVRRPIQPPACNLLIEGRNQVTKISAGALIGSLAGKDLRVRVTFVNGSTRDFAPSEQEKGPPVWRQVEPPATATRP